MSLLTAENLALVFAGLTALAVLLYAAAHWMGVQEPKAVLGAPVAGSIAERVAVDTP